MGLSDNMLPPRVAQKSLLSQFYSSFQYDIPICALYGWGPGTGLYQGKGQKVGTRVWNED